MATYAEVAQRAVLFFGSRPALLRAIGATGYTSPAALFTDEVLFGLARHLSVHPSHLGDAEKAKAFFAGVTAPAPEVPLTEAEGLLAKRVFNQVYVATGPTNLAEMMNLSRDAVFGYRIRERLTRGPATALAQALYVSLDAVLRGEVPERVLRALPVPVPRGKRAKPARPATAPTAAAPPAEQAEQAAPPAVTPPPAASPVPSPPTLPAAGGGVTAGESPS